MNINRVGLGNINISKAAEDKVLNKDYSKAAGKDAASSQSKVQGNVTSTASGKVQDDKALKKVCEDFESIFVNMMFKSMRDSVPKSEPFGEDGTGGGMAKETFQEMLDEELSNRIARGKGMGFADMLYRQLSKKNKSVEDNNA